MARKSTLYIENDQLLNALSPELQNLAKHKLPWIKHILLLFIDGLGIGQADCETNPCVHPELEFFNLELKQNFPVSVPFDGKAWGIDACLGMAGLPQSATGQTALLTGINASQKLGRHLNGFPNAKLREIIAEHSIFKKFVEKGEKAAFLNSFRPPFFDYDPFEIIRHLSVTTVSNLYAGLSFFDVKDIGDEKAVYQDITNQALLEKGFDAPLFTPEKAGEIIGKQSQQYRFSLFEYFQTDKAGHARNMESAVGQLIKLERFLKSVLKTVDLNKTLVLVTSDHGNIEDLSVKGHTRNPTMTLIFGKNSQQIIPLLNSLTDITPLLLKI